MTEAVIATAPGKIVLSGEYAVLDGAPAIAMAVDRRASVRAVPAAGAEAIVSVAGFDAAPGRYRVQGGVPQWLDGGDRFSLLDALLGALRPNRACDLRIDTRDFRDPESGAKYGLGSSAAVAAAVTAALGDGATDSFLASSAHRAWQRGLGSGVDVATSIKGGLLQFRMQEGAGRSLVWPQGLCFRVVWTGVASDTGRRLADFSAAERHASRDALCASATDMATAWGSGSAAEVLARYPAYLDALRRLDDDYGLGIFSAGHARLAAAAAAAGLFYKPCGAGGGDIGIAIADNDAPLDAFIESQAARVLNCRLDGRGATRESEARHEC